MTPTLDFLDRNPGLMAEMIADFQQRKNIVDAAKSKEPIDANVIDNPNLRAFIPYPKMMYDHKRHLMQKVVDAKEHEQLLNQGWLEQPWSSIDVGVPIGAQAVADPMADERMESIERRMLDLERMMGEILEVVKERRKPGRPPNNPQS